VTSNPPAVPADTSTSAWKVQMKAIRARSREERIAEWEALNRAGAKMEADGVRRQHPGFTEREVFLTLVRRRYGDELAGRIWPDLHAFIDRQVQP
jgi:hypothetical protein